MPFEKGQSGNPSGRPKENAEVKALAREHAEEAISRLADWVRSDNPKASVSAAIALLDRGFGKPAQSIGGDPDGVAIAIKGVIDLVRPG
jgi:hypothetical protein